MKLRQWPSFAYCGLIVNRRDVSKCYEQWKILTQYLKRIGIVGKEQFHVKAYQSLEKGIRNAITFNMDSIRLLPFPNPATSRQLSEYHLHFGSQPVAFNAMTPSGATTVRLKPARRHLSPSWQLNSFNFGIDTTRLHIIDLEFAESSPFNRLGKVPISRSRNHHLRITPAM